MAHPVEVKARAMTMLLFGCSVTTVATTLGVPKQTISRWKPEAFSIVRAYLRKHPERAWIMEFGRRLRKNGT